MVEHYRELASPEHFIVQLPKVVPQGSFIGFFEGDRLIHAMIAVGGGCAAGNKNACIGIGNPIGWEVLNLADLDWNNVGHRNLSVYYRAM